MKVLELKGGFMNWNEIPQFISTESCYHVNYGLVGYVKWIEEEQKELNLQLNPDFQRGHVWTEAQQQKYIEYILMGGKSGRTFYFNWPSSRICHELDYNDYVCVDGLQRTTAIQKFIHNELKVFGQFYKDFGKELGRTEYSLNIRVNDLQSKKDVLTWYVEMNEGGTPHSKDEIERVKNMIIQL